MDVTKSKAWEAAEWDYSAIQADIQMAPLWGPSSREGILKRLRSIIRRCPQFYPAILELGIRLLRQRGNRVAERMIDKGFRLMIELGDPAESEEAIDAILENLENIWRFDISMHLLEIFSEHHSLSALQHDSMAHAAARHGEMDVARRHIDEAVRLEPGNKNFWANKGWYHLMEGKLDEADRALSRAHQLKKRDPVVEGNIRILKYLRRQGGTYWDYLERPLNRDRIDRLADREKWNQVTDICDDFNTCRIEAFAQSTFLKSGINRSLLSDMLSTLYFAIYLSSPISNTGHKKGKGMEGNNYRSCFKHNYVGNYTWHFKWYAHPMENGRGRMNIRFCGPRKPDTACKSLERDDRGDRPFLAMK